jgi:hypothetical protein
VDWPDWTGETAIIIGTGPSATECDLAAVEGRARVFAIKSSWRLAPFADALYGLDKGWWVANRGVPQFKGWKFSPFANDLSGLSQHPRSAAEVKSLSFSSAKRASSGVACKPAAGIPDFRR